MAALQAFGARLDDSAMLARILGAADWSAGTERALGLRLSWLVACSTVERPAMPVTFSTMLDGRWRSRVVARACRPEGSRTLVSDVWNAPSAACTLPLNDTRSPLLLTEGCRPFCER